MKVKPCDHSCHHSSSSKRYEEALEQVRSLQLRITSSRKEILSVLAKSSKPLSSEEVFSALKKGSSDLVTVYRSLTTLEESGLLRRYDFGDGVRRYELSEQDHHHHYIRCRECGAVEAFEGCEFEETLMKLLAKRGYQMIQHTLDVQALCSRCLQ